MKRKKNAMSASEELVSISSLIYDSQLVTYFINEVSMAIYKAKQVIVQRVIQTYWEEFDTENQTQWENLIYKAEDDLMGCDFDFPKIAPSDPAIWFEVYKRLYCEEFNNREEDDWITIRKKLAEHCCTIENANGDVILKEDDIR